MPHADLPNVDTLSDMKPFSTIRLVCSHVDGLFHTIIFK